MITKRKSNARERCKCIAVIMFLMFCEYFFFRNVIGAENEALIADRGDGRLTMLLTEHWWNFFRGKESFSELAMFYPAEGILGYSDLLLGYGVLHSLFRLVGINMFVAYKWTLIVIHCLGTVTAYYLLKKKMNIRLQWALFGTLAFSFSDSYARNLGHTQLGAISALPLLLILLIGFIKNFENRKRRNIYAYVFITWFVLLTYNSWYVAYYTGLYSLIFLITYFIFLKSRKIAVFFKVKEKLICVGKDLICYIIYMVILYLPFIRIYLPALQGTSGYSWDTHVLFMPELIDIINVSESNWMLGSIIEKMHLSGRGYSSEVIEGFSIVLLCFFLILGIVNARRRRNNADGIHNPNEFLQSLIDAVFVSVIVGIALVIRLSSNGISLWGIVYYTIPGAKSIRAVARFFLWLSFPMAVITAYMADQYIHFKRIGVRIGFSVCAVILLFVSNINTIGVSHHWNLSDELEFISNVPEPPKDAEVLYIIDTAKTGKADYVYQLDAYEIATWYSLKTINGRSGRTPSGWGEIRNVCGDSYEKSIYQWIERYEIDITTVYAYDCATNTWIAFSDRPSSLIERVFSPSDNLFSVNSGAIDHKQKKYAWVGPEFKVEIRNDKIKDTGLVIRLHTPLEYYILQEPDTEFYVNLYVDGQFIQDIPIVDECVEYVIPMADHESDEYCIELETNGYFIPQSIGQSNDPRSLSIAVYYIGD